MPAICPASSKRGQAAPAIGIMAGIEEPFGGRMPEEQLCRLLALTGRRLGCEPFVFAPGAVARSAGGRLTGYALARGRWEARELPLPAVVYDRTFPRSAAERTAAAAALRRLRAGGCLALNGQLPGKWQVHRALAKDGALRRLLPPTAVLNGADGRLRRLLEAGGRGLFLKPAAGMQGRGVLAVRRAADGSCALVGRRHSNEPLELRFPDAERAAAWILRSTADRPYLLQPLLRLRAPSGEAFDVRVLAQKDGAGRWRITGAGVRAAAPGSITANLHGGGRARSLLPFLTAAHGREAAEAIAADIRAAALLAAGRLEGAFGRFAEFGFDFGVEPSGRIWFIEANAKPGRAMFRQLGDARAERLSAARPLSYARRLLRPRGARVAPAATIRNTALHDSDYESQNLQEVHS